MDTQASFPSKVRDGKNAREFSLPAMLARLAGVAGVGLVTVSSFLPWFVVPSGRPCRVDWLFRVACIVALLLSAFGFRRSAAWRQNCGRSFTLLFIGLLFFPHVISVWCPSVAGEAAWLQAQHESLARLTGDIYTSQEEKDIFWRQRVAIVDRPLDSAVVTLPDWAPETFGWSRLVEMVEWYGSSPWFVVFVRKGWALALAGSLMVLCALAREGVGDACSYAIGLIRYAGRFTLMGLVLSLVPTLTAGGLLARAKEAAQRGDRAEALRALREAAWCMPAISQDGRFVLQTGLLENALGQETAEAQFYRARVREDRGFVHQAGDTYLAILSIDSGSSVLKRECIKALLRQAINASNSGESETAGDLFAKILNADPCNLKANYALQLACLRRGDAEALARLQTRMAQVYRYFNTPTKEVILADGYESLAYVKFQSGDASGAIEAWGQAKRQ